MITFKTMKSCFLLAALSFVFANSAYAQPTYTVSGLRQEFHDNFNASKEKYEGKTLTVTGKVRHVSVSDGEVYITCTGDDGIIAYAEFILADAPTNRNIATGSTITVTGTLSRIFAGATGRLQFKPCTIVANGTPNSGQNPKSSASNPKSQTNQPVASSSSAPKDMPMGKYNVHQSYSYDTQNIITFFANGTYSREGGSSGRYKYNRTSKVITFQSGPFEGWVGLYYTQGRNNPEGKPMIALDWNGKVPNLSNAYNGQYQYAELDNDK